MTKRLPLYYLSGAPESIRELIPIREVPLQRGTALRSVLGYGSLGRLRHCALSEGDYADASAQYPRIKSLCVRREDFQSA